MNYKESIKSYLNNIEFNCNQLFDENNCQKDECIKSILHSVDIINESLSNCKILPTGMKDCSNELEIDDSFDD